MRLYYLQGHVDSALLGAGYASYDAISLDRGVKKIATTATRNSHHPVMAVGLGAGAVPTAERSSRCGMSKGFLYQWLRLLASGLAVAVVTL